jgi:hypothetical protein
MTLLDRIHANQCAVRDCSRTRAQDAEVCRADLNELWAHRLDRQADGTYLRRRTFALRDETGWVKAA